MQGVGFLSLISQTLDTDLHRVHFNSDFSHLSRSCKIRTHPIHRLGGRRRELESCALPKGLLQVVCNNVFKGKKVYTTKQHWGQVVQGVYIFWDVCLRLLSALACAQNGHSQMQSVRCDAGVPLPPKFHLEGILPWGCLMMPTKVEIRAALKAHSLLNFFFKKKVGVRQEEKRNPCFLGEEVLCA